MCNETKRLGNGDQDPFVVQTSRAAIIHFPYTTGLIPPLHKEDSGVIKGVLLIHKFHNLSFIAELTLPQHSNLRCTCIYYCKWNLSTLMYAISILFCYLSDIYFYTSLVISSTWSTVIHKAYLVFNLIHLFYVLY